MRLFNTSITRAIEGLLSLAMGLLGFSACSSGEGPVMYGMPTAEFEIKGKVTNEQDAPVRSKVIFKRDYTMYNDTVATDADGEYLLKTEDFPMKEVEIKCLPLDEAYEPDSVIVESHFVGGDHDWFQGVSKSTVDFKLKQKPQTEEEE